MNVKTKITKEQAVKIIQKPNIWFFRKRKIEHTELVYIPHYLFEFEVEFSNKSNLKKLICVDGIDGEYAFLDNLNIVKDLIQLKDVLDNLNVSQKVAEDIAKKAIKDIILMRMKKGIKVTEIKSNYINWFNYPYWIGLFRKNNQLDFDAIDALTGQKQGLKLRPLFIKKIMQENK